MARRLNWTAAALALTLLAGIASPAQARDERERPDLKVELVGLPLAASQREVKVRVTNTSVWWANETKLKVETVSPTAGNAKTFAVENLDPGQSATFTYTLAGPCDGQMIKAQVTAGKNYAGVPESELANNTVQAQACPPQAPAAPQPAPRSGPSMGDPVDPGTATVKRGRSASVGSLPPPAPGDPVSPATTTLTPGRSAGERALPRELVFEPTIVRSLQTDWWGALGNSPRDMSEKNTHFVGWDGRGLESNFTVAQTAVKFDLANLSTVPTKSIVSVSLQFVEREVVWGTSVGQASDTDGCVVELGRATNVWTGSLQSFATSPGIMFRDRPLTSRFVPHTRTAEENRGGFRERAFDLTEQIFGQILRPDDPDFKHGYVLHGAVEDPKNAPASACMSTVENLKLTVTYVSPK